MPPANFFELSREQQEEIARFIGTTGTQLGLAEWRRRNKRAMDKRDGRLQDNDPHCD